MQNNVAESIEEIENIQIGTELVEVSEKALIGKKELYLSIKRTSDLVISGLALVALTPLIGIISALIKLDSKGEVFYKQKRIGKNGKYFTIYKFRTMVDDSNDFNKYFSKEQLDEFKENYKLEDDPRITRIGKFLRRTSLDEIPQLINIIKGDLSIIGPRPIVDEEIDKYGIDRSKIDLEITESAAIDENIDTLKIFNKIKEKGFDISIDDFGTGYSSLSMLENLPIDVIKIDKVFVDKADLNSNKNIINYIKIHEKRLGVRTIVEGVETKEQIEFVRKLKCDVVQGYYYSKPISKEEFEEYIIKNK